MQCKRPALTSQSILDNLSDKDEGRLLSLLRGLSELALSAPVAFEEKGAEIIRFVMQEVVYKKSPSCEVGPVSRLGFRSVTVPS